jgi:hypothetical protein
MNERIRELAEQSGLRFTQLMSNPMVPVVDGKETDLEKLAELIVKECVDKIETYRIPVGNSAAGEMACEWTYDALKEIRDEIREHFGVEE